MSREKRVLVVSGSRIPLDADEETFIRERLEGWLQPGDILHHGGAKGVDRYAGAVAEEWGLTVRAHPVSSAEWNLVGKRAGPLRNRRMLAEAMPDMCFAFPRPGGSGTLDFVGAAVNEYHRNILVFWLPPRHE